MRGFVPQLGSHSFFDWAAREHLGSSWSRGGDRCLKSLRRLRVSGHRPVCVIQAGRVTESRKACDDGSPATHACCTAVSSSNPWPEEDQMSIGLSLFAIMVGAILKFAVTAQLAGISLSTVGVILMVVGVVGLLVSLWLILARRASPEF